MPSWVNSPTAKAAKRGGVEKNQLTISTIFWVVTATGLVLNYAVQLGGNAVPMLIVYALFVVTCSCLIGLWKRNLQDAFYFGVLYSLLAYLAVAGGRLWMGPCWQFSWRLRRSPMAQAVSHIGFVLWLTWSCIHVELFTGHASRSLKSCHLRCFDCWHCWNPTKAVYVGSAVARGQQFAT